MYGIWEQLTPLGQPSFQNPALGRCMRVNKMVEDSLIVAIVVVYHLTLSKFGRLFRIHATCVGHTIFFYDRPSIFESFTTMMIYANSAGVC